MKKIRLNSRARKTLRGRSRGFTLIEVLIALALFAIIAIVFAGGLSTASRAVLTADVRATAESLARTQMEYVKELDYNDVLDDGEALYAKIDGDDIPERYMICSVDATGATVNCSPDDLIIALPWDSESNEPQGEDNGLQKITLVVKHEGRDIITLEGYKVDR